MIRKHQDIIVAIDFDGVLCNDQFPDIGIENPVVVSQVKHIAYTLGCTIILWTSRVEDKLQAAIDWCRERGLIFDTVNSNAPHNLAKWGTDPRKIFANWYVDDRALLNKMDTRSIMDLLAGIIKKIERGEFQ